MTPTEARKILEEHLQSVNLRKHCYAVGAVMKALAVKLNGDPDRWETVGILHDGDYEGTKSDPTKHTLVMHQWLVDAGVNDQEILNAILSHNFAHTGQNEPSNLLEWSLYCCDELTGFIIAVALVRPDRKLASVDLDAVKKKWPQKAFAAGVKREQIELSHEKLHIPLDDFITLALTAMQGIHETLGL